MVRHTNKRRHTKRRRYTRRSQRGGGFFDNLFSSKKPEQTAEEEAVKKECDTKLEAIKKKYSGAEGATTGATGATTGTRGYEGATTGATNQAANYGRTQNLATRQNDYSVINTNTNREGAGNVYGTGYGMYGGRSRRHRRHRKK